MKRLISTLNLEKDDWLGYRKQGICGSDAAAICNLNPYKSAFQVYQDKISEYNDNIDSERMRQGRDLEEYVAQRFSEETGLKVRRANFIFQSEEYPFMLADFDRFIVGQNAGLECKTVSPYAAEHWKDGNVPIHYQMQVQHYLAVSGFERFYVAGLILGQEFVIRVIERDEEMINNLIAIEERFWNENVLSRVMPDPDGSKGCGDLIAKQYFYSDAERSVQLLGYDSELRRREEIGQLIDKLEAEKAAIDQKIQIALKDSAYGTTENYRVSWLSTESKRLEVKLLKAEQPDLYDRYLKSSSCRRLVIKRVA